MNVYEVITERILKSLQDGVVPWRCPWRTSTPKSLQSGKAYRGVNVFLLSASRFSSPWWLTYKQASDRKGQVRKGEQGTPVIFWKMGDSKKVGRSGKPEKLFILRYYTVFNVAQCDGIEAPVEQTDTLFNPIEECDNLVKLYQDIPQMDHGGSRACYIPTLDRILMPTKESFHTPEEYYSTLFHELTHSTGSENRLARKGVTDPIKFGSHDYSFEELVAECGAAFLCGHSGIINRTLDNSAAYIANWARKLKSEPRWIVEAGSQAAKAADYIQGIKAKVADEPSSGEIAA